MRTRIGECKFEDCHKSASANGAAKGYCRSHYGQLRAGKPLRRLMTPHERAKFINRTHPVTLNFRRMLVLVVKESEKRRTLNEQANALGITLETLYRYRVMAKRRGMVVADPRVVHLKGSPRWENLDRIQSVCPKCKLRGEHICTGRAEDYARSGRPAGVPEARMWPGRTSRARVHVEGAAA
jgi:hypothetical protein